VNPERAELDRLIQAYLDEALTDEEARRLQELFKADPSRLDEFVRALDLHGTLAGLRSSEADPVQAPPRRPPSRRATVRRFGSPERSPWAFGVAAAGAFLGVVVLLSVLGGDRRSQDRARARAEQEATARRRVLIAERERAEEERLRAEARLREIGRKRDALTPLPVPDPVAREKRDRDLADLDSEKERVEREMREAIDRARKVQAELARIPEQPKVADPVAPPSKPSTQAGVAALEIAEGEVFLVLGTEKKPAASGQELTPGQGLEVVGRAVLRFGDTTKVELGPGTVVRDLAAEGGKRFFVDRGSVDAVVTKQPPGQPMAVVTPHGEATVLGTTLRITVDPDPKKGTRLEVSEGKVQLRRRSDGKTADVTSGHFAVAATGVELSSKPIPIDEIVLLPLDGKLLGGEWRRVQDDRTSSGTALEAPRLQSTQERRGPLGSTPLSYAEFAFRADAGKDYHVWIRGMCTAAQNQTEHDMVLLVAPGGRFSRSYFQIGPTGDQEHAFNGYGTRPDYWWVGGNADLNAAGLQQDTVAVSIRFVRAGEQKLRLYPWETPMRIDAVWLSTSQKTRPEAAQRAPRK